jgi:hypothetical protein
MAELDKKNVYINIYRYFYMEIKKVAISLLQTVKAPRVARGQGSHVT